VHTVEGGHWGDVIISNLGFIWVFMEALCCEEAFGEVINVKQKILNENVERKMRGNIFGQNGKSFNM
jgi:hypothetical protein